MNRNDPSGGQYRRPRVHFSARRSLLPATTPRALLQGSALLMGLALLMTLAMIPLRSGDPDATPTSRDAAQALQADCTLTQQLTYRPCGHQVVRRTALPAELAGKGRTDLEAAYDAWQVTSFSPAAVAMEQQLDMYCPQHIVLLPDGGGQLCAWQNRYGDALSLLQELGTPVTELPDSVQDSVRQGMPFDSQEALEKWLESVES